MSSVESWVERHLQRAEPAGSEGVIEGVAPAPERVDGADERARVDEGLGEAYDRELFEELRSLRRALAQERGVPPYIVFGDVSLRDMARRRPTTPAAFLLVKGVGEWKAEEFGPRFIGAIRAYVERGSG